MVALVRVADALVPMLRETPAPLLDDLTPLFHEPAFEHLGLTREEIFRLWEGLRRACDKAAVVASRSGAPMLDVGRAGSVPPVQPAHRAALVEEPEARSVVVPVVAAAVLVVVGALGLFFLH
jgi:hypothetical protein